MSYLNWDKAENERVEQNVGAEMAEQPFSGRRGIRDMWSAAERDLEVQEREYRDGNPPPLTFARVIGNTLTIYPQKVKRKDEPPGLVMVIRWLNFTELWLSSYAELNGPSSHHKVGNQRYSNNTIVL